jgi:hypothetical protein
VADRVAGHEVGRKLIDDSGDHGVEVGDLVVQFEIATGKRLERYTVSSLDLAVARQIRAQCCQSSNKLHSGHVAQQIAQLVRRRDDRVLDHLQRDPPCHYSSLAAGDEDTQRFDHAIAATRRDGSLACKGSVRGVLCVEIIVLATLPAILPVGRRHLQNRHPGLLQEAQ